MASDKDNKALDRRGFLKFGGTSAMAAAAVAAPILADEAAAQESDAEKKKVRYRETDHVKAFYRTNGYETLKK
jgi:secreted PhoX family phosphatase